MKMKKEKRNYLYSFRIDCLRCCCCWRLPELRWKRMERAKKMPASWASVATTGNWHLSAEALKWQLHLRYPCQCRPIDLSSDPKQSERDNGKEHEHVHNFLIMTCYARTVGFLSSGNFICVFGLNLLKNPPNQLPPLPACWALAAAAALLLLLLLPPSCLPLCLSSAVCFNSADGPSEDDDGLK